MNALLRPGELTLARVREFLAQCSSVDDVRELRDQAEAVARYKRDKDDADQSSVFAAAVARRAERRLGELIAAMPKAPAGRPPSEIGNSRLHISAPTLEDRGITRMQSSRWQAVARVPEDIFEEQLRACVMSGKPPTAASILRAAKDVDDSKPEPERFHPMVAVADLKDSLRRVIDKTVGQWPSRERRAVAHLLRDLADEYEVAHDVG